MNINTYAFAVERGAQTVSYQRGLHTAITQPTNKQANKRTNEWVNEWTKRTKPNPSTGSTKNEFE